METFFDIVLESQNRTYYRKKIKQKKKFFLLLSYFSLVYSSYSLW